MGKFTGLFLTLGLVVGVLALWAGGADAAWETAVDPWVLETAADGETEFIVFLAEQADLSAAETLPTKLEKGTFVFEQLTATAERTQPAVIAQLQALGVEYRPYWVANMIWVRGDLAAVEAMARRSDISHLYANPTVKLEEPLVEDQAVESPLAIEWNILMVNADQVWEAGYTGQEVIIGGQDTGYYWEHNALKQQYRGWDGQTADHNYSWHDAIHSGGGSCGADSSFPCDDFGHGTHTMGTMVGDDGGANQIGMAPGARWIGCRNMDVGNGTPISYSECYQWFIAPTDLNDQNPDPSQAPHVINNSWSCPPSEGCTDPNILLTVVENVRTAGILTAHSAGNSGSSCETVNAPAAIYDASFSVGSVTNADTISSFSSRGPVTVDGSDRLKPDITAPGSGIRSSLRSGSYGSFSGTSMAAPHVAGLTALLISANSALAGQVDQLEQIMTSSAVPKTTTQQCGSIPGSEVPNHTYGYGRIDALAALEQVHRLKISKVAPPTAPAGSPITYTITITHQHSVSPTNNVVLTDTLPGGTTLITATMPFAFDGTEVRWDFANLAAGSSQQVQLIVSTPLSATGPIINDDYTVYSDDVGPVRGSPVPTQLDPHLYYFPLILLEE